MEIINRESSAEIKKYYELKENFENKAILWLNKQQLT